MSNTKISLARTIAADKRAYDIDPLDYPVDWSKATQDKRKGAIHAWDGNRTYIGQFHSHGQALDAGATVTRMGLFAWFNWAGDGSVSSK